MKLLALVLGFTAAFVLFIVFSNWYFRVVMKKMVVSKHEVLEHVTDTGKVPQAWSKHYNRRLASLEKRGASSQRIESVQRAAKRQYLRRLRKLRRYVTTTSLVDSEATRTVLLDTLTTIAAQWESM